MTALMRRRQVLTKPNPCRETLLVLLQRAFSLRERFDLNRERRVNKGYGGSGRPLQYNDLVEVQCLDGSAASHVPTPILAFGIVHRQ